MKRAYTYTFRDALKAKFARVECDDQICGILPAELLVQIFRIIPQEYRRFSGVCKHWQTVSKSKGVRDGKYGVLPITWLTRAEIIRWTTIDEKVWNHISNFRLSLDFIHEHAAKLDWEVICRTYPLTQNMIEQYKINITPYIYVLHKYHKLNFDCEKIKDIINWDTISKIKHDENDKFIILNHKYLNWRSLCEHTQMSEKLMQDFANYLDWEMVSKYQNMSSPFIIAFRDKIIWKIYLARTGVETQVMELVENPELLMIIFQIYTKITGKCKSIFNLL